MTGADPRAAAVRVGEPLRLSSKVERVTQNNPSLFTGPGTNTHLVGSKRLILLDPGQNDDWHFEALVRTIGERDLHAVIPSHAHRDHWPLARRMAERYGAPVLGFAESAEYQPDRLLCDGEVVRAEGVELEAIHTPGHASDHLCFAFPEEKALFSGDHVMGWSTSIIAPPDGNLNHYMTSLDRLLGLENVDVFYPAHGPAVLEPEKRMIEIRDHRLERTRQALSALEQAAGTPAELVERIYTDVDPKLHGAARFSLIAHLEALIEEGVVERQGNDPMSGVYCLCE